MIPAFRLFLLLYIVAKGSVAVANDPDPITLANVDRVKLLAELNKPAQYAALGPGKNEITLYLRHGYNWIVDDQNFHLIRKVEEGKRKRFPPDRKALTPDGKVQAERSRNYRPKLIDASTGKVLHELPKEMTQEVAFSPDGKTLAVCYVDGTLGLWDVATGRMLRSAKCDANELYSLDWNAQGDLIVTGGNKGNIVLWDPKTLRIVKKLMYADTTLRVRFTRDGTRIIATSCKKSYQDDKLYVWTVNAPPPEPEPLRQPKAVPLAERPNILFAIADDWGYPHAGVYGDPVVKTPSFDRIAREGVLFPHAFASSPSCTASRGAILTGQHFWSLGSAANLWGVFPDKFTTFPEKLKQMGYITGFEGKGWGPGKTETPGRELTGKRYDNFAEFLKQRSDQAPFCYWLGTSDPHRPYEAGSGKAAGIDLSAIDVPKFLPDCDVVRNDIADYYVEIQRFDALVGNALKSLEAAGELDNTMIVMTSDHGMPFPRCKGNLYDSGVRVPLAIRFSKEFPGNRKVDDFVSLIELSNVLLEKGGAIAPLEEEYRRDAGRELIRFLESDKSGFFKSRNKQRVVFGTERHVPAQEAPNMGGYPSRGIRTPWDLYIQNHEPQRWPNGTPNHEKSAIAGAWYADCDNGPTKSYVIANKDKDDRHRLAYKLAFAKRPASEFYDITKDPEQLANVFRQSIYGAARQISQNMMRYELRRFDDPREIGGKIDFDNYPYLGGAPKLERKAATSK